MKSPEKFVAAVFALAEKHKIPFLVLHLADVGAYDSSVSTTRIRHSALSPDTLRVLQADCIEDVTEEFEACIQEHLEA